MELKDMEGKTVTIKRTRNEKLRNKEKGERTAIERNKAITKGEKRITTG
jgi:hypothetical protein